MNRRPVEVPDSLVRLTSWTWRLLVVTAGVALVVWVLVQLRLVVLPVFVALLLVTVMAPVAERLRDRGVPNLLATWIAFLGFFALVAGLFWFIVPSIADEFDDLSSTLGDGIERIEDWLIDGPLDVDRQQIAEAKERIGDSLTQGASTQRIVSGARLVFEVLAGTILAIVVSFFVLKDGREIQAWTLSKLAEDRRPVVRRVGRTIWATLGGYVRGAAMLGVVEAIVIGAALFAVGASVVLPVMALVFMGAFFPFLGAIVTGIIAVLVALVTGGTTDALIVAAVVLAVQQLDNDLLAPFIFGKAVKLHPLVIIVALTGGAAVAGLAGAFLSVPVIAVVVNVTAAVRADDGPSPVAPAAAKD